MPRWYLPAPIFPVQVEALYVDSDKAVVARHQHQHKALKLYNMKLLTYEDQAIKFTFVQKMIGRDRR